MGFLVVQEVKESDFFFGMRSAHRGMLGGGVGLGFWCSKIFLFLKRDVQVSHTTDHMYHIERNDDEIILISAFILQLAVCWACNTKQLLKQGFTFQFRLYVGNTDLAKQNRPRQLSI